MDGERRTTFARAAVGAALVILAFIAARADADVEACAKRSRCTTYPLGSTPPSDVPVLFSLGDVEFIVLLEDCLRFLSLGPSVGSPSIRSALEFYQQTRELQSPDDLIDLSERPEPEVRLLFILAVDEAAYVRD